MEIGATFGRYRIVERLGAGAWGEVFLAEDTRLGRTVALKFVSRERRSPQARRRLLLEARTVANLNHPNICTVHDVGEEKGELYIAMEHVRGRRLGDSIPPHGLPTEIVVRYGLQVADALSHAHRHGVVHRDLKSNNVMTTPSGDVKVLDFGLADAGPQGIDKGLASSAGTLPDQPTIAGTLPYMAPEVLSGKGVDKRSDIWALGVLMYEALTGSLPFVGPRYSLATKILRDPPQALPAHVPPALRATILRCLEKDSERRYQDAGEVRAALEAVLLGETPSGPHRAPALRRWRLPPIARSAALFALLAAVLVAALLLVRGLRAPITLGIVPFAHEGEESLLGEVVAERLISRFTAMGVVVVAPYLTARQVSQRGEPPSESDLMGVQWLLRGEVESDGNETTIDWRLTSAEGGPQSSGTVQGTLSRLDLMLQRATVEVLQALGLPASRAGRMVDPRRTPPVAALLRYVEAIELEPEAGIEELVRAAALQREALALDDAFAAARARLVVLLLRHYLRSEEPSLLAEAKEQAQKALDSGGELAMSHVAWGMAQELSGQPEAARKAFARAFELEPGNDAAARDVGTFYRELGRSAETQAMLRRAIEIRPEFWDNHYALGHFLLFDTSELEEAKRILDRACDLDPDRQNCLVLLGLACFGGGKLDLAETYFREALHEGPYRYAYSGLAALYYSEGRFAEARDHYQKALDEAPDNPRYHVNVAEAQRQLGEEQAAREHYATAVRLYRERLLRDGSRTRVRGELAVALAALGRCEEADLEIERVLREQPAATWTHYYSALAFARCRRDERARDLVLELIEWGAFVQEIRSDPDFERLRAIPEVSAALREAASRATG
ncbi:MAG TPA: protein kinase [Thermoanaerobaculia bacterium]|nr:protein kinase [Thermoanaerobaculia bacterium]